MMLSKKQLSWVRKNINPKKVFLMGGEPLLYPYLRTVLQLFNNVTIASNGVLIEENIDVLRRYGVSVQLSIEGGREETDRTRGAGMWDRVLDAARLCRENDVSVFLRSGLWRGNLKKLDELFEVGRRLDVQVVLFPRIDKPPLSFEEQVFVFDKALENDAVVGVPNFFQYIGKRQGRCGAGSERVCVLYDGRVTPCQMDFDFVLGRVGDNIESVEKMRDVFVKHFKQTPLECIGCDRSSVCKGGCYVSKYYTGCPLRRKIDIGHLSMHSGFDIHNVESKGDALVDFMRDVIVC